MVTTPAETTTQIIDPDRVEALRNTLLLDTKAEEAFDRLTNMAARILSAPISLVSLIDIDRQFIKSGKGTDLRELPLSHSLCRHVVATGEPLIIEDARQDPLVRDNPSVTEYDIAGYLGLPISTSDGFHIGSLCVIDQEVRKWSEEEINIVRDLTSSVMMEIELRVQMRMEQVAGRKLSTTEIYGAGSKSDSDFGIYEIVQKIGTGGMADVYLAKHKKLGTLYSIKHLRADSNHHKQFLQRFQQEAQIVARLKHENIIRVFDYGVKDSTPYMVMEYIAGDDLGTFLERNDKLSFWEDGAILLDIASALDYAHAKGIVHRDVKPANVMLRRRFRNGQPTDQFHATLMDFGIAKVNNPVNDMTKDDLVGTLRYVAPEQIEASDTLDYRADIYSFGILAYKFLTGHFPYNGRGAGTLISQHMSALMPDPRQYEPSLSQSQVDALAQALAKNPDERPQSATKFVTMLGRTD